MSKKTVIILSIICILLIVLLTIIGNRQDKQKTVTTSSGEVLSNKKIGWGIKRSDNHEQPDLGSENKKLIEENGDIAIGNKDQPFIYLTFDLGY